MIQHIDLLNGKSSCTFMRVLFCCKFAGIENAYFSLLQIKMYENLHVS